MANALPPPQNLEAEESVLGAIMLNVNAIEKVAEVLTPADFYRQSHGLIYEAALALHAAGEPVDSLTVANELDRRGLAVKIPAVRLRELASLVPATANVRHYADIVHEMATLRALLLAASKMRELAEGRGAPVGELVEEAEALVFELSQARHHGTGIYPVGEVLQESLALLRQLHEQGHEVIGVPSGYIALDRETSGFQPGNLIILAARPSMGKSGLALGIAANATMRSAIPVLMFTLEMSRAEIVQRLISAEAGVESNKLRNGSLKPDDWDRVYHASSVRIDKAPFHIDDSGTLTMVEVRSKARRHKLRHPSLGLIIIDYLQLMTLGTGAENRQQEVSQISRSLKALARELEVPIIALSQLSRAPEQRHDKRPILSDLRDSGSIEQDADLVMFLYRDEYYFPEDTELAGVAELNLAKHRNGPTGTVKLSFVKRYAKFAELQPGVSN